MMMKKYFIAFACALSMLCSCSGGDKSQNETVDEATFLAQVAVQAQQINSTLPKQEESYLELTSYMFDPQQKLLMLKYRFLIDDVEEPTEELINQVHKEMVITMSHNPEDMECINHGISYQFDYYTKLGDLLFSTSITPEDFKDVEAGNAAIITD